MNKLHWAMLLSVIANIGSWFQFQGHYWSDKPFLKTNTFIILIGGFLSIAYWHSARLSYEHFGMFWNIRLLGFGVGTVTFGILTWTLMNEIPSLKTVICLLLALCIVLIQITNVVK